MHHDYTVLLIEDNDIVIRFIQTIITDNYNTKKFKFISVTTVREAIAVFSENYQTIDLVLIDGNLGGKKDGYPIIDTLPVMRFINDKRLAGEFKGKSIAISTRDDFNKALIDNGCDYAINKNKELKKLISARALPLPPK